MNEENAIAASRGDPCPACTRSSIRLGLSELNSTKLSEEPSPVTRRWLQLAKDEYHYGAQGMFVCGDCGLLFVHPVLSDLEMMDLLFKASDMSLEGVATRCWSKPRPYGLASAWSTAVRVPSLNETLRGYVNESVRVLDIGSHGGQISLHLDLPEGSHVDLLQLENAYAVSPADPDRLDRCRQFNGVLTDLVAREPAYRANIVLALHVLEHVEDPYQFLRDTRDLLDERGLFVVEVPFEPDVAVAIALDRVFELSHNLFFTPESLQFLLRSAGFRIEKFECLHSAHTGVGTDPYPVLRALCSRGDEETVANVANSLRRDSRSFYRSLDALFESFAGSIAFQAAADFAVFVFDSRALGLAQVFRGCAGYKGTFSSNDDLELPNVFRDLPADVEFLLTVSKQDRAALRNSLGDKVTVI